jgi:hypothetical protein
VALISILLREHEAVPKINCAYWSYAALLTGLVGCAAPYRPPSAGPTATVQYIAGPTILGGSAFYFDNDECRNAQLIAEFGHEHHATLSTLVRKEPLQARVTAVLPANGPVVTRVVTTQGTISCGMTLQFNSVPGGQYDIWFDTDARRCEAIVYSVDPVSGRKVRDPTARLAKNQC